MLLMLMNAQKREQSLTKSSTKDISRLPRGVIFHLNLTDGKTENIRMTQQSCKIEKPIK